VYSITGILAAAEAAAIHHAFLGRRRRRRFIHNASAMSDAGRRMTMKQPQQQQQMYVTCGADRTASPSRYFVSVCNTVCCPTVILSTTNALSVPACITWNYTAIIVGLLTRVQSNLAKAASNAYSVPNSEAI